MNCLNCGTVLPDGTPSCPTCGTKFAALQPAVYPQTACPTGEPAPAPAPKKKHTGLIIGIVVAAVVLVAGVAFAVLMLLPATSGKTLSPAYAPVKPNVSVASTSTLDTSATTAAESAVTSFYAAIDSGDFAAASALVTSDTKSAVDKSAFEGWTKTTIQFARSVVDGDSAEVYGRESQQEFGSTARGVEFTLQRMSGAWLIQSWLPVDEQTLSGTPSASGTGNGTATLNDATARDVVSSLLQARQGGDAQSIRMLTTAKFQNDNSAVWLDGVDNTPYFTAFSIKTVTQKGSTFVVTVTEQWNSGAETGTYTVVDQGGAILVDAWSSK